MMTTGGNLTSHVTFSDTFPDFEGKPKAGAAYTLGWPQWLTSFGQYLCIVDNLNGGYVRVAGPGRSLSTVAGLPSGSTAEGTAATSLSQSDIRGPNALDSEGSMFFTSGNRQGTMCHHALGACMLAAGHMRQQNIVSTLAEALHSNVELTQLWQQQVCQSAAQQLPGCVRCISDPTRPGSAPQHAHVCD